MNIEITFIFTQNEMPAALVGYYSCNLSINNHTISLILGELQLRSVLYILCNNG